MVQQITCQDRFWILDVDEPWDGEGYPSSARDIRCCMLDNAEELAVFQELWERLRPVEAQ